MYIVLIMSLHVFSLPGFVSLVILLLTFSSCSVQEKEMQNVIQTGNGESIQNAMAGIRQNVRISPVVRKVFQDSRGTFWFGTEGGAFRLMDTTLVQIDGIQGASGGRVTIKDITEDRNGAIWFGHTDGLSVVDGEVVRNYYESDGLISPDVWCVEADSRGRIWIGTIEGACIFDGRTFVRFDLPEGMIDTTVGVSGTRMVNDILEDRNGTIWISTNAGLFSLAGDRLVDMTQRVGIQTRFVGELFEDHAGDLWISTKEGLYHLRDHEATNVTAGRIELGKGPGSVAEDAEGRLWFVFNQHDLYTLNGKEITTFRKPEGDPGPVVFQIFRDQGDRLWFVGYGGAFRLENGGFVPVTRHGPW